MGMKHVKSLWCMHRRLHSSAFRKDLRCKLLVVGAGTGGCSVAWRLARKLRPEDIIVLEPSQFHYYQPQFTLVATGLKTIEQSKKPMESVLPTNVCWLRDQAEAFDPCSSVVYTKCGERIKYEYMVIAVGMKNDYDMIPGLRQALDNPQSGVCTIYAAEHCANTWRRLTQLRGGHVVFTYTNQAGKCSGAAQKIMYLADDYFRQHNLRDDVNITYNTGGRTIFGVPKYAKSLQTVLLNKDIAVNYCTELVQVAPKRAVFMMAGGETITLPYNLLHVTPPMSPPACVTNCDVLVTDSGYLDVDKQTLQHNRYRNIYGIGDCTSTPNSKTAAAVAAQSYVVEKNLLNTMYNKSPSTHYDGYGACTILTSYKKGILAESVYDKKPCETFPFDQSKERRLVYYLKKDYFPHLYWNKLIKGKWDGPSRLRKIVNPFRK